MRKDKWKVCERVRIEEVSIKTIISFKKKKKDCYPLCHLMVLMPQLSITHDY